MRARRRDGVYFDIVPVVSSSVTGDACVQVQDVHGLEG